MPSHTDMSSALAALSLAGTLGPYRQVSSPTPRSQQSISPPSLLSATPAASTSSGATAAAVLDYSSGQEPISQVKPAHRPLHTQVSSLLDEREVLLEELARHRRDKEGLAEEMTAGLRLDRDELRLQLEASEASRRWFSRQVTSLTAQCRRAEAEVIEQRSAAEAEKAEAARLKEALGVCEASLGERNSDAARLSRAAIEERRRSSTELVALKQKIASVHEQIERSTELAAEAQGEKDSLGGRLSRMLDEREALREQLANTNASKERLAADLTVERSLTNTLRTQLEITRKQTEALQAKHARLLEAQEAAASTDMAAAAGRMAELEAAQTEQQRRQTAAFVAAADERASWRQLALQERGGVQAAVELLQPLRSFLEEAAVILSQGAHAAHEMRFTHGEAEKHAVIRATWQAVAAVGGPLEDASRIAAQSASTDVAAWLQPLVAATSCYTRASLALARGGASP